MKRLLFATLLLALFSTVAAVDAESATNAVKPATRAAETHRQVQQVDAPASTPDPTLPTVSKFQMPGIAPNLGCAGSDDSREPCTQDDGSGGGGGYTEGGCNCSRYCDEVSRPCQIASATTGCRAASTSENVCHDCSTQCN